MGPVTITSDLGVKDFYVAALKGAIISNGSNAPIIDITHSIKPFDIKEAAFTAGRAFRYFPKGSIHIVHVNATDGNNKLLLAIVEGHYFLTFDNGFLSLAFEQPPTHTYQVNDELLENSSLLFEDAIGKTVNLLLKEFSPTDFAHPVIETVNYRLLQPIISQGSIRGTVLHIDSFGNAIVNISRTMFKQFADGKQFTVMANVGSTRVVSKKYSDVEEGDMVCLFNASGFLEIAINKGRAENLLGLKIDSPVLVMID